jgi:hypothetical protein
MQRPGKMYGSGEHETIKPGALEVSLGNPHADHALAKAVGRQGIEIAGTAERAIAILDPFAFEAPVGCSHSYTSRNTFGWMMQPLDNPLRVGNVRVNVNGIRTSVAPTNHTGLADCHCVLIAGKHISEHLSEHPRRTGHHSCHNFIRRPRPGWRRFNLPPIRRICRHGSSGEHETGFPFEIVSKRVCSCHQARTRGARPCEIVRFAAFDRSGDRVFQATCISAAQAVVNPSDRLRIKEYTFAWLR